LDLLAYRFPFSGLELSLSGKIDQTVRKAMRGKGSPGFFVTYPAFFFLPSLSGCR
jgi:hypothetical protein